LILRLKPRNRRGDFDDQINKPELPVLRPKSENPAPPWFWGSTKKPTAGFDAKPGETVVTSFEAILEKTVATSFEAKLKKTVAAGFEAKPAETVAAGFDAKSLETVDIGFKAQPRNPRSSSPRARCRPHPTPPDLSIARPPSTWPVWASPVFCTRSPTPVTICHATPATCTPWDKQTRFSKWNKDKRKTKQNYPRFKFKLRQVNDSS
jgi:hypothetical protein